MISTLPLSHKPFGLGHHIGNRPGELGAARVGHDAEGAKLVAALLNRQKSRRARAAPFPGQVIEFALRGKIRFQNAAAMAYGTRHHLRQAVIGLRPENDVNLGRAPQNFGTLCLSDTASDSQTADAVSRGARP